MPDGDSSSPSLLTAHVPLLLANLIAASVWIYLFTDWFPVFGSVLGLGGVLVVVPALQGLMAEARRKAYAGLLDRLLFQDPGTARAYLLLLVAGVGAGFVLAQPLRITAAAGADPIEIRLTLVSTSGEERLRRIRLQPGSTEALPLWQTFFGGTREVRVAAAGLPGLTRPIGSFDWPRLALPGDLWSRPVLLLRPEPGAVEALQLIGGSLQIVRRRGDRLLDECPLPDKYLGEPVWIGGGQEVIAIDGDRRRQWLEDARMHGLRYGAPGLEAKLITLPARAPCAFQLDAGDSITWTLVSPGEQQMPVASGTVELLPDLFHPQEALLRLAN